MRHSLSRLSILALVLLVAAAGTVSAEGPVIRWSGFYEFNKNATPETLVMKWVGEATGTTIQPMHVERGDMSTWWSTTLASLDFPDVMQYFGAMGDDPNIYGPQGLFVALDVEREAGNMPNLDRVYTAWDIGQLSALRAGRTRVLGEPDRHAVPVHRRFPGSCCAAT